MRGLRRFGNTPVDARFMLNGVVLLQIAFMVSATSRVLEVLISPRNFMVRCIFSGLIHLTCLPRNFHLSMAARISPVASEDRFIARKQRAIYKISP